MYRCISTYIGIYIYLPTRIKRHEPLLLQDIKGGKMSPNESRAFLSSASRKATEQAPEKSQVYSSDAVVYPFSHNHGSGSGRGPFSTSMIMGGRVCAAFRHVKLCSRMGLAFVLESYTLVNKHSWLENGPGLKMYFPLLKMGDIPLLC